MSTFRFTVPVTGASQEDPIYATMYESDTLIGARTSIGAETLTTLGYSGTPPEVVEWVIAAADETKHHWLTFSTASLVESQPAYLAPKSALGTVVIEVWTETAIGAVISGIKFRATPLRKGAGVGGTKTIVQRGEATTNGSGYASLTLYADSGEYDIELVGYSNIRFDTTNRSGETINFASEL